METSFPFPSRVEPVIRKRMLKKIAIAVGIIVGLAIVVSWTFVVLLESRAKKELETARQQLAATGAPMTIEAIMPEPVPEEQNAAALYVEAKEFGDLNDDAINELDDAIWDVTITDSGEAITLFELDAENLEKLRGLFQDEAVIEYLGIFEEAALRPRYQRDFSTYDKFEPYDFVIPDLGSIMQGTRLLTKRSALRAIAGDIPGSLNDLQTVAAVSRHIGEDTFLLSQLTSIAISGMLIGQIWELDRFVQLSNSQLTEIKSWFEDMSYSENIIIAQDVERLFITAPMYETAQTGDTKGLKILLDFAGEPSELLAYVGPLLRWHFIREEASFLRFMAESRGLFALPYPIYTSRISALEVKYENEAKKNRYVVSGMIVEVYSMIFRTMVTSDAQILLARIGLSLSQYHNDHGAYPDSLQALVPEYLDALPLDPFSGSGFVYQREGDAYLLYSIGPNGVDDGGTTNENGVADEDDGDLVWKGRGSLLIK